MKFKLKEISNEKWIEIEKGISYCKALNILSKKEKLKEITDIISRRKTKKVTDNKIPNLVIPVTFKCNLNCKYCLNLTSYTNTFKIQHIDIIIKEFIKYHLTNNKNKIIIEFSHGGEPTLDIEYLKETIFIIEKYSKNFNIKVIKKIATNCFFDNDIADFIINHFDKVIVSLDGPKKINDKNRIDNSGKSIFFKVNSNISKLYSMGLIERISCVIFSDNIKYLKEVVNFFNENYIKSEIRYGKLIKAGKASFYKENINWNNVIKYIIENSKRSNYKIVGMPCDGYSSKRGCIHFSNPNWFLRQNQKIAICPNPISDPLLTIGEIKNDNLIIYISLLERIKGFKDIIQQKCQDCLLEYFCPSRCIKLIDKIDCNRRIEKFKQNVKNIMANNDYFIF